MAMINHPYHVEIKLGPAVELHKFDRMPAAVHYSMDRLNQPEVTSATIFLCSNGHQTWIWSRNNKKHAKAGR